MKQQIMYWALIGGLVGLVTGAGGASLANKANGPMVAITSNSDRMDKHFIEQMIPHHEDAVLMAKLAREKAQRQEIRTLAAGIAKTQQAEIDGMREWYRKWFGQDVPEGEAQMGSHGMMAGTGGMHMGMMGDDSDLTRISQAADFDRAFIEHMVPHHQMAVMMARMLANGTNRSELVKLADDIIQSQSREIDQMRKWYGEWYP